MNPNQIEQGSEGRAVALPELHPALTGLGLALAGATLLLLRAYLPRWVLGAPVPISWIVPATVFASYVVLGLVAILCLRIADRWLSRYPALPMWRRMVIGSAFVVAGTGLTVIFVVVPVTNLFLARPLFLTNLWILSSALGTSLCVCVLLQRASAAQRKQALQVQLEADLLDTSLARAELSMIEAQIEPHFLFNTLAHVKRQYRIDAAAADQMLAGLIKYLEHAAPALRRADWTVGDELELVQVYLDILAYRFGQRLRFAIEASATQRMQRLPALTIATLVENAVRHGLAPKPDGGSIQVTVETGSDALFIEVCDDGVGLRQTSGTGLGLATVRARLRSAFGEHARLLVEPREPAGVRAALSIPRAAD
jgi:signal transduction histidine kinase